MKTFVIFCERYARYGGSEPELFTQKAKSFTALVREIADSYGVNEIKDDNVMVNQFRGLNGDGCDYYIIKELLPDETLSEDLTEGYDKAISDEYFATHDE